MPATVKSLGLTDKRDSVLFLAGETKTASPISKFSAYVAVHSCVRDV